MNTDIFQGRPAPKLWELCCYYYHMALTIAGMLMPFVVVALVLWNLDSEPIWARIIVIAYCWATMMLSILPIMTGVIASIVGRFIGFFPLLWGDYSWSATALAFWALLNIHTAVFAAEYSDKYGKQSAFL